MRRHPPPWDCGTKVLRAAADGLLGTHRSAAACAQYLPACAESNWFRSRGREQ